MCTECSKKGKIAVLELEAVKSRVVNNQATGEIEKLIFSVDRKVNGLQYFNDGVDVATSVTLDPDGKPIFKIKLKIVTGSSLGYHDVPKSMNHVVILTAADLAIINGTPDTKIRMEYEIDGQPEQNVNGDCYVTCTCVFDSFAQVWLCECFTICDYAIVLKTHVWL